MNIITNILTKQSYIELDIYIYIYIYRERERERERGGYLYESRLLFEIEISVLQSQIALSIIQISLFCTNKDNCI
jgi:hypothetical protein